MSKSAILTISRVHLTDVCIIARNIIFHKKYFYKLFHRINLRHKLTFLLINCGIETLAPTLSDLAALDLYLIVFLSVLEDLLKVNEKTLLVVCQSKKK